MIKSLIRSTSSKLFYFGSSLTLIGYLSYSNKAENLSENESNKTKEDFLGHFDPKDLLNQPPEYIETSKIENLISFPRFQNAVILIKLANKHPNKSNFDRCISELDKLSNDMSKSITKLEHLTKLRFSKPKPNQFLSDGLALYISQLLNYDINIDLAFKSINCDNRFFKSEPPGTRQKLAKLKSTKRGPTIYEDPDYFILFEFFNNFSSINSKFNPKFFSKFNDEIKFLTISEHVIKHRPKINIWSNELDNIFDELDDENFEQVLEDLNNEKSEDLTKVKSLKHKVKLEFIFRNETFILELVDKIISQDPDEFIRLGGMEFLILMYEKHKNEDTFIQIIGNCLNILSLNPKNRRLFVESGWIKRLHEMRFNFDLKEDILSVTKELIAHKILYNLHQNKKILPILYPNLIYPLHPLYTKLVEQTQPEKHQHIIDIIFIHGLRGSVFKTWRQDDTVFDANSNLLNKLSDYIDKNFKMYTHCWPADWLPKDLGENNIRLLGVNYESLFSLWGQGFIEETKLKSSIKQRALDLAKELKQVGVGERPCIWICHSMGGLIVKQMLVNFSKMDEEDKKIYENTKGIVFLSTPHLGSSIAKTVTKFKLATKPSIELYELSMHNDYLIDLNKNFMNLLKTENKFKILSLCESLPTYLGFNLYTQTVTEESANLNYGEFYLVENKDHLNICKPSSQDCFVYLKIKQFLKDFLNKEISNCNKCKKISDENVSNFFELNQMFFC